MDILRGTLKNLNAISLKDLPSLSDPALQMMLRRVERRIQRPGASISGYNGAGGLSGDITVDVRETK